MGNTIGWAVKQMQNGERVRRAGWNGKGMWLSLVDARAQPVQENYRITPMAAGCELLPWVGMKTADNRFVPWLCSQTDLLATDWESAAD